MKKLTQLTEAYANEMLDSEYLRLIIEKLKNALKEELNAWYGYIIVKDFLVGSFRPEVVKLYEDTAKDELEDHAYWLMNRINELGGTIQDITASPASWLTATHTYISPKWSTHYENQKGGQSDEEGGMVVSIFDSLMTNVKNEIGAIETYREIVELAQMSKDWTTESKCKEILADEEEHLQLLQDFLDDMIEQRKSK